MKKGLLLTLLAVLSLSLVACKNNTDDELKPIYDNVIYALLGQETMDIELNDTFTEPGYIAKDSGTDIRNYITIEGSVDTTTIGEYTITYTLDYADVTTVYTRVVHVIYPQPTCTPISGTSLSSCSKVYTEYLHTIINLTIYVEDGSSVDPGEVFYTVAEILNDYNNLSDKYKGYEGYYNVYDINLDPDTTHNIDQRLFDMIQFAVEHQPEVNNAFNIALGPVLQVWHDVRETCNTTSNCTLPTNEELFALKPLTNPDNIILDAENLTITMQEGMSLDLGGFSKGYISGVVNAYLDAQDLHGYLFNNGESNVSVGGSHPTRENGLFNIAITDPDFEQICGSYYCYATVYLGDGMQLVTSGDIQQYFEYNGQIYHHIINNATLFPERYSRSVSVISNDPALLDMYSTAIFTMSLEDGLAFVNANSAIEAIWYGLDGTITMSDNFQSLYLNQLYK